MTKDFYIRKGPFIFAKMSVKKQIMFLNHKVLEKSSFLFSITKQYKKREKNAIIKFMKCHDHIWDLGGTLLDNYTLSTQAFLETLALYGIDATYDEVHPKLRESTEYAIQFFIPNHSKFLTTYKEKEAEKLIEPILFDGAKEILEQIVASGSRNFLVSHRDSQVITILEKTGIKSYFTEVVTSVNNFARKPDPESLLYLKNKYDITYALVIGDREIDKIAGENAGFDTLLVGNEKNLLEVVE